ncbi:MAG: PASTA domain-containing protein [Candidatus Ancillula sp.]|jgi:serine/threonine-protein kinase|nr:PASTA domain-containing protein [Candidatus Ancillula sp.]
MTSKDDERVGQTIDGRYVIIEKIAHGGMATVYRALDRRLDREVALKLMHPHLANGPEGATFVSRFRREARAAARLHHPGIVTVFDQGLSEGSDGVSYLTMEYVRGTNLRRRLKDVGTFSVGDALKNMEHILRALAAAHRAGLVHRDVKPENVLINHRGQLQITDFGLARVATEMSTSTTGTVFGTVAYLAPEIIETGQSDARSDVYSVGIMLYELIAGQQPYEGTTPIQIAFKHVNEDIPVLSDLHPEVPRSVSLLMEVFSARDKTKRPPDAAKALELLSKLARSLSAADLAVKLPPPINPSGLIDDQLNLVPESPPEDISPNDMFNDENVLTSSELDSSEIYAVEGASEEVSLAGKHIAPYDADLSPMDTDFEHIHEAQDHTLHMSGQDAIETNVLSLEELQSVRAGGGGMNSAGNSTLGAISSEDTRGEQNTPDEVTKKKKRKRLRIILLTTITVLALLLAGVTFWWYEAVGPGSYTTVPYGLDGKTADDAKADLDAVHLKYSVEEIFDDTVPVGMVVRTDPYAGVSVSKNGDGVKIFISKGIQKLNIPVGLTGNDVNDVSTALKTAGFSNVKITRTYNRDVPKDIVISLDPEQGTLEIPYNTEITLLVSDGPKPVNLPSLQGMNIEDAIAIIDEYGLKYSRVDTFSDNVAANVVISQDPARDASEPYFEGETIRLTVSKGPEMTVVPSVERLHLEEAKKLLQDAGLEVQIQGEADFGLVKKQNVPAGTKAKRGSVVILTVV